MVARGCTRTGQRADKIGHDVGAGAVGTVASLPGEHCTCLDEEGEDRDRHEDHESRDIWSELARARERKERAWRSAGKTVAHGEVDDTARSGPGLGEVGGLGEGGNAQNRMEIRSWTVSNSVPMPTNTVPIMKDSMVYMNRRIQNTPVARPTPSSVSEVLAGHTRVPPCTSTQAHTHPGCAGCSPSGATTGP